MTFDMAGNPDGPPTVKRLRVQAAGQSQEFTFDTTGRSVTSMGWVTRSFSFTANSSTTTLEFVSSNTTGGRFGAALDNVRVAASGGGGTCAYPIAPASQSFSAGGGNGSVTLTTQPGCAWSASSSDGWVSITSSSSGAGSATITYSVAAIGGGQTRTAPLLFVSVGQINAQLPFGVALESVEVRVRTAAGVSNTETIAVSSHAPRLFTKTLDGAGEAIAVHADWTLIGPDSPVVPGEIVILFLTGLGAVNPPLPAGAAGGDGGAGGPLNLTADTV